MTQKQTVIEPASVQSLLLWPLANGIPIGSATGFAVQRAGRAFLITNWHVVAGRNPATGALLSTTGAEPDAIAIWHNIKGSLGRWVKVVESLKTAGATLWKEHPKHGKSVDVVALPLTQFAANGHSVELYLHDPLKDNDVRVEPAEPVSVVGFPFGNSSGGNVGDLAAIWATGFLASDLDIDWNGLPAFLIDCRARPGQSGSPVLAKRSLGYISASTNNYMVGAKGTRFMGVYSGRISEESDLGIVWRPSAIEEILLAS